MIEADDLFLLYRSPTGDVAALRGLDLRVASGERVVVHGRSGSGKSSLVRLLSGFERASAGRLRVAGLDPATTSVELRRDHIGLVNQQYRRSISNELSCAENVALPLRLRGSSAREARSRAGDLLDRVGLSAHANDRPDRLSGGEAQLVAVAAAIAHRPKLLIADEPTAELDRESAAVVYALLSDLATSDGVTVLVVTHDADAALFADRVVHLADGRVTRDRGASVVDERGWLQLSDDARRHVGRLVDMGVDGEHVVLAPRSTVDRSAKHSFDAWPAERRVIAAGTSLAQRFGERTIFDSIDITATTGVITSVVGPSGCGKTSLLRLIVGLDAPSSGRVLIDGIDVHALDRAARARLRGSTVGYLAEGAPLLESDTVMTAVTGPATLVDDLLERLDLARLRDRPVSALSGGERQRTALARVLSTTRPLMVFDEPTSQLDELRAEAVAELFDRAAADGKAIVCASHDPKLLARAVHEVTIGRVTRR